MEEYLEGFFLQASLILALGAQNLFVLDSGLRKRRHLLVATLCSVCDASLIALGVVGAATLFIEFPWFKVIFGALGVLFLVTYGFLKIKENPVFSTQVSSESNSSSSVTATILQTLGFSLLNPHVYLDTVVLIGGYSAQFDRIQDRLLFGSGAASFSVIWFFGLASFAAAMSRYIHNSRAMRVISLVSGLILLALSVKLGRDVVEWCQTLLAH